jgi:hypothetical protein
MNLKLTSILFLITTALWMGCRTSPDERGPNGTVAYYIRVESSVPGVTIETNRVVAGKTPLAIKVYGDVSGGFHNFDSPEFVVRAIPETTNQFVQVKTFRAGKNSAPGDRIPGFLFFDMSQPHGGLMIDSFPDR